MRQEHKFHRDPLRMMVWRESVCFHLHIPIHFGALWVEHKRSFNTLRLSPPLCFWLSVSLHVSSSLSVSASVFPPACCLSLSPDSLALSIRGQMLWLVRSPLYPHSLPRSPHLGCPFLRVLRGSREWGAKGSLWVEAYEHSNQTENSGTEGSTQKLVKDYHCLNVTGRTFLPRPNITSILPAPPVGQ